MGRISAPFGVKGWVKLEPYTAEPANLAAFPVWWISDGEGWKECRVEHAKAQGRTVVAKFPGCDDRDAAALYRGREVAIPRDAFPAAAENEFYWADLVGLAVVNVAGEELGTVAEVFETGANDVLVVVDGERQRLIPFTAQVVQKVDLAGKAIRVDWGLDY